MVKVYYHWQIYQFWIHFWAPFLNSWKTCTWRGLRQLILDTPCTAGARRRWDYANLPLTTTPNLLDSSTFLSTDAIHVRNMFFKSSKKVPKSRSKTGSIYRWYVHNDHFFSTSKKSGFQNPTVVRHVSTPPISASQKVIIFRTDGRTDGQTEHLILTSRRT